MITQLPQRLLKCHPRRQEIELLDICVTPEKSLPDQFPHLYKEEFRILLWAELCAPLHPKFICQIPNPQYLRM